MATRYGSTDSVRTRTGITPADLGMETDPALDTFINSVLDEITDLMDRRMRKSYLLEATVPPGLNGIANDAASDSIRVMIQTRQAPVVRIDDFSIRAIQSKVFSADILARLKEYAAGTGVGSYDVSQGDITDVVPEMDLRAFDAWVQSNE